MIPVVYARKEKPKEKKENVREKTWRKDGFNGDNEQVRKIIKHDDKKPYLKQISDSFNSLRDKSIFLGKVSSALDDVDMFNLTIKSFEEGYMPDFNICYLHGEIQKDNMLYQTFLGTESCDTINLYLIDRLSKINKKRRKEGKKEIAKIPKNKYLFTSKGKQMNQRYFAEKMKEIVDKLGIYNLTPKGLRRYFNTHLESNSIKKSVIKRLMGHKGDIGDEHYNMLFEHAFEGEREELALDFLENIKPFVSLGNGNRKYNAVEKEIDDLKIRNKGLEATVEELREEIAGFKTDLEEWNMIKADVKTFLDWIKDKNKHRKLTQEELDVLDEL